MKIIHVLAGDSLVEPFKNTNFKGEIVVCRECLIDGELKAKNLEEFWRARERFLSKTYPKEPNFYEENVKREFEKLAENKDEDEINLWFEYELFCRVNMWFCLSFLSEAKSDIYIVYPIIKEEKDLWKGFGALNEKDLKISFENRIKLNDEDILLGKHLWEAFQNKDFTTLQKLGKTESESFPKLKEVCKAASEIETRPKKTLQMISAAFGELEFGKVFQKFNETEDIYGFGDLQVKKIYDQITG